MKKIWKQRYQMLEEAGSGGNAKVYKVFDLHLEKEWAMKILDEKIDAFFRENKENINELQVLKKISHPNFPRIVDAFEEEGRKLLIMDYVHGITLEEILKKGPMKETEILVVMKQVCEAVLYLHQQTPVLLFLDLKPANIMIEENGTVKLVDLGSVCVKERAGRISGSLGFASPEQIKIRKEGSLLTEQSDIFSFGMVLYVMVTGNYHRLPIVEPDSRLGICMGKYNPEISKYLVRILEKCTRGNPLKRYSGMREVKKELEYWEEGIKKKRWRKEKNYFFHNKEKKRWYQERSILCTEGKHSFYIAKKFLILVIGILCLMPGKEGMAWNSLEELPAVEMKVVIRDAGFRKVLVKDGCAYQTNSNILLEIPWEEIEGEKCRILVQCEDESKEEKGFYIDCIYVK